MNNSPEAPAPIQLPVEGMHCASCVGRIESALSAVEGVASASANLATGRVQVRARPGTALDHAALARAIEKARYQVPDRKSTRLNSSHVKVSYADFRWKR